MKQSEHPRSFLDTRPRLLTGLWVGIVNLTILAVGLAGSGSQEIPDPVDYDRQIRPILSDRCYRCHGPDGAARKAGLRLDTRSGALAMRDEGAAIVEGSPGESLVLMRLRYEDVDDRMPPAYSNLHVSPEEIELIERWISEGAPFDRHWAFVAPDPPPLPEVSAVEWPRTDIDRFILSRLEKEGLSPAPEGDRTTLARRSSFQLTGLAPDLGLLDQFLADEADDAWEKWVAALLASPRFGERMASVWLDVARYADSYGYQSDVHRPMWQWRDWVIDTFNSNLPFDQFVTWQLAGDLLDDPTPQQRLATAFNRLHRQTNEGGSVEEEYRIEYVVDRTQTFSTAFLGLTFECAHCHDHKFDPISQREFYSLSAFFSNIDESGLYSHFTSAVPTPALTLHREGDEEKGARLEEEIRLAEEELTRLETSRREAFDRWRDEEEPVSSLLTDAVARFSFDTIVAGKSGNSVDADHPAAVPAAVKPVPGAVGNAILLTGDDAVTLPGVGAFTRADPFSFSFWLKAPEAMERAVVLHRSRAWTDAASQGYQVLIEDGCISAALIHFWPGDALAVQVKEPLEPGRWTHVVVTYDGSSRARGLSIWIDGKRAQLDIIRDHLKGGITGGGPYFAIGERFRDRGFRGGAFDELVIVDRVLSRLEIEELHRQIAPIVSDWAVAISNNDPVGITSRIVASADSLIEDLDVGVAISHTWVRELSISLTSPGGTGITLKKATPEVNTDIDNVDVIFDDEGLPYDEAKLPLSLRIQPQGPGTLSDFNGESIAGSWELSVIDGSGVDTGVLESWSLRPTFPAQETVEDVDEPRFQWWLSARDEVSRKKLEGLSAKRKAFNRHLDGIPKIMAMEEMPGRRKTYLLERGRYDRPKGEVEAGVPEILGPLAEREPRNRLGLARWLFEKDHPLAARVAVNRLWQMVFGRGLVARPGAAPDPSGAPR